MRTVVNIDTLINQRDPKALITPPVTIRVNKFNEVAAKSFADEMEKAHNTGQKIIPIVIDSYGGQVYSLLSMIDCIKSSSLPVATIVEGKAMSCGAMLLSYGTEGMRFASKNSTIMLHDVSNMSSGKVEEIKADANESERLNQLIFRDLAKNCGKDEEYFLRAIHERGHADWYLTAEQAVEEGIIQHIRVPTLEVKISIDYNFR